jgi:leader peptidase (prepilin peptidase) / N-methyltransferase
VTCGLAWARERQLLLLTIVAIAAVTLARYGPGAGGIIAAFGCGVLVALAAIDLKERRLPNRIVLPTAGLVLAARLVTAPSHWVAWIAASFGIFALFVVLALIYPAGLGMGDVKLSLLLGALLGPSVIAGLLLGTFSAGVFGAAILLREGGAARSRAIPYGPFLAFGTIVVLLVNKP